MRVLDLFSGIGGFSLGLERAGFQTIAFAEIDKHASKVLARHWPAVPNLGDVTEAEYPDADFICAGFPCQDISYAGAGAGLAGERSGLWREVVRALRVVRPLGALLENVAALLGRGMGRVLGDLAEVGYDAEWHCIPASAVGAPHRRDRIWIFADPGSEQHEGCRPPISGTLAEEFSRIVADASPMLGQTVEWSEPDGDHARLGEVADTYSAGLEGRDGQKLPECAGERATGSGGSFPNANRQSEHAQPVDAEMGGASGTGGGGWWSTEPNVGRVAHGVPSRVDRLRCLGNAVVPQIPEIIGRAILASRVAA